MSTNNDDDWTPRPGYQLEASKAEPILTRFEQAFRANTAGRSPKTPTWCTFNATQSRRINKRALAPKLSPDDRMLFFYFEGGRELREATANSIRRYLDNLEPWEDWDMYIFDRDLQWCIAITHSQMKNQKTIILAEIDQRTGA